MAKVPISRLNSAPLEYRQNDFINSHIKMLQNQQIDYKDTIEENCMSLLF